MLYGWILTIWMGFAVSLLTRHVFLRQSCQKYAWYHKFLGILFYFFLASPHLLQKQTFCFTFYILFSKLKISCCDFYQERFPDPKSLVEDLHLNGFKAIWMLDPGIKQEEGYFVYDSGSEKDIWIQTANGKPFVGIVLHAFSFILHLNFLFSSLLFSVFFFSQNFFTLCFQGRYGQGLVFSLTSHNLKLVHGGLVQLKILLLMVLMVYGMI